MKTVSLGQYQLSQFMLGTAQFGLPYGVANASGQPSFQDVCAILECAHDGGVNCLDTAPGYGESELVVGRALRETGLSEKVHVVTKALRVVDETLAPAALQKAVEAEIVTSLERLQLGVLPLCLMHWEANFHHVDALLHLKEKGLIHHVGCSITDVSQARIVLRSGLVEAMQIPLNLLDQRLTKSPASQLDFLSEARERGVAIFARSAYLQGLILMQPEKVPGDLLEVAPVLQDLRGLARVAGIGIEELALRFVLSLNGVSCAVVGVDSVVQTQRNLEIFAAGPLDENLLAEIENRIPVLPDKIIKPHLWQNRMPDASLKKPL